MELSHQDNHNLQELDYKTQLFQDKNNNKVSYVQSYTQWIVFNDVKRQSQEFFVLLAS
jgi:hypothetical protein